MWGNSSSSSAPEPHKLVPTTANVIGQIQVSRILFGVDFTSLYNDVPKDADAPEDFAALLETAKEEIGVDFKTVDSAMIFSYVAQGEEYFGLIARGVFDQIQLLATMETEIGSPLALINYGEIEIHVGDDTGDVPSISFLGDNTLVVETITVIRDVIDVYIGAEPRLSGTVYDSFNNMGDPLVRAAVKIPPEVLDELSEAESNFGLGMPIALEAVQDLNVLGFAVDKLGDDITIEVQLTFYNGSSATELSDTFGGLINVGKGFAPSGEDREILDQLELSVVGPVNHTLQVALSDLQKAAESLKWDLAASGS